MRKGAADRVLRNKETAQQKVGLHKKALVIGGGIAGIRAALDIADAGFPVVLVEKKPTIGGHMAQLAEIFPMMDPAINIIIPLMKDVGNNPNIRLLTLSEVIGIKEHSGNFHIRIKKNPRFVDSGKCDPDKCDNCVNVCPVTVPSEFDEGLTLRKAIYIPFPQAVPSAYTIDHDVCILCGKCAQPDACGPGAVNLAEEEEIVEEDVRVVIVTTGYELHGQENAEKYEVEECPDVITSLQFERMLSPEGPTKGMPKRLSDGKVPSKIAFVDCVGSGGEKHLSYCGRICDTYLAKQAILFKEAVPDGKCYALYVDTEAKGGKLEHFMKRAQEEAQVNYIQAEVTRIYEQSGKVKILAVDRLLRKNFDIEVDMVVLALPMVPSSGIENLTSQVRIEDDKHGRRESHPKLPSIEGATPGIFIAGCAQTPMDIQSTIIQASAAAGRALEILAQTKKT